ncbi:telomerase RNA component interacting RNase-like [Carassius carassius]|uniref:telomerase RNA component interacting RNase-like n=1 Tax=Carassius carassius TaxID=217509 RepID=UPI002869177B|nr:telomerase RNA component interacting RNase-like [Carassius carassius]
MEKKQHKSDRHPHHQQSPSSSSSSGESGGSSPAHGAPTAANAFANDGSFMELFKKKMEEERRKRQTEEEEEEDKKKSSAAAGQAPQDKKPLGGSSFVGKRRGGARLALKTGMVAKKQKLDSEMETGKGDAWTKYMAEVKKYKAHQCGDDDKTRPLVK